MQAMQLRAPFTPALQPCGHNVRRKLVCQAAPQGEGAPKAPSPPSPAGAPPQRRPFVPPDFNPDVKMERMDKMGEDVWGGTGVVQLDSGDEEEPTDLKKVALLVAGDAAALLLFAAIGRLNHSEGLSLGGIFDTALPFLLGWFATAPFTGAYGKEAQGWKAPAAAGAAAKSWAVALPVAHIIRGISKGYIPSTSFLIVSLAATGTLLVGWRTALAATTPEPPPMTPYERMIKRVSKSGGPLDFLRFIQSMTRRW